MAVYQSFEELPVWRDARKLVATVYELSQAAGFSSDHGLKDQIQRAAVSVMTNIAEGFERRGRREFCQFLNYTKASSGEVRSLAYVALDQSYITEDQFNLVHGQSSNLSRSITGFSRYLSQSDR